MTALLFLDVDGTLLPFGSDHSRPPGPERVDTTLGDRLLSLPCSPVWATTWDETANTELCPRLGWPPLPLVSWPDPEPADIAHDRWFGLHWKTRPLTAWAGGRPFAWLDDELTDRDRDWISHRYSAPTLLLRVERSRGIGQEELEALERWCSTLDTG